MAATDGVIRIWDLEAGGMVVPPTPFEGEWRVKFADDGLTFITASDNRALLTTLPQDSRPNTDWQEQIPTSRYKVRNGVLWPNVDAAQAASSPYIIPTVEF